MSKIQEKIETLLDELQEIMESNKHLTDDERAIELLGSLSLYWAHMDDEGKDYVHCATQAIDEKTEWNV
jgi:hypothetical protein